MTLGLGWAILDAHTGENRLHSHVAHQVSLALEVDCAIGGPHPLRLARGEAAIIPAGIQHCLTPAGAPVRTIYVDPLFDGLRDLIQTPVPKQLNPKEAAALEAITSGEMAKQWIGAFVNKSSSSSPIDGRLHAALSEIVPGTSPSKLAQALGLSTTRLRELAIRDFGVPTAKLLQWLQLQHAIDALRQTRNLADAAAAGGFSDQAHFTRRLVEWFGVTPSLGLAQLEILVIR
ncbi:helix-turn-helix domain-containing protein [Novosphingobium sp. TH158]|jgi:AraC-like DNA-binding protein|uniref:AraC family transcriptional regulator n=1 Tax=Novosphingobium sp. TH158 TaxID=2067455 RepID=UPI000C7AC976|nr:helix-turn-helix domain-containing protein [Novosphingobium sp. TH158]PLK26798.1 AraC family transcriptional regulator [Novosphingobium sp. TH158]